jgi:hypothetical protein
MRAIARAIRADRVWHHEKRERFLGFEIGRLFKAPKRASRFITFNGRFKMVDACRNKVADKGRQEEDYLKMIYLALNDDLNQVNLCTMQ